MNALNFEFEFKKEVCCNCHMSFAMPYDFYKKKLENKTPFYCPNGHSQYYTGESEEEKLKRQIETLKRQKEYANNQVEYYRKDRDKVVRQKSAIKGVVTKIKRRVGNGVCPCCNRTFQNLMSHMKTKHPGFKEKKK